MIGGDQIQKFVYIDESGISSRNGYSVYVCICVYNHDYEAISKHILQVEKNLRIGYIHWSELPWKLKTRLTKELRNLSFSARFVCYENPIFPEKMFMNALRHLLDMEEDIYKVVIDGKKSNLYKRELKKIIRDFGFEIGRIKIVNDKSEPVLRVADFIAGLLRSYFDSLNKNPINLELNAMFKMIKNKIELSM